MVRIENNSSAKNFLQDAKIINNVLVLEEDLTAFGCPSAWHS